MRTSPTNIGLWLMAALSARDFGYITFDELLERTRSTYAALDKLERYEGVNDGSRSEPVGARL